MTRSAPYNACSTILLNISSTALQASESGVNYALYAVNGALCAGPTGLDIVADGAVLHTGMRCGIVVSGGVAGQAVCGRCAGQAPVGAG